MKIKAIKNFLIFFLIFIFVLAPISPAGFFSIEYSGVKADSAENVSGYQEWNTDKTVDKNISIAAGATLVIKEGVTVSFEGGEISVYGTLVASGTSKNPIIFKRVDGSKWSYAILVKTDGKLIMRNTDVSGGGYMAYASKEKSMLKKALAYGAVTGCIDIDGGWLDVENSNFHDNETAVFVSNKNPERIKVNRSKFINNESYDVNYIGSLGNKLDFQYNWWGNQDGPSRICSTVDSCWYNKFESEVNFSNWLTSENFRDPVIIIPGILGSEKHGQGWQIDPILHTYDNLYGELIANGYVSEKNLFTFPYEWRDSNVENAKLLKIKIQEIKQQENWPKVDIVAHSMGGLLAREYIESDSYSDDIDQLVTLGTPNNGAPEAYLKWEAGAFISSPSDSYFKHRFSQEAKENGYNDIFHYIQSKIPSIKELLPVYGYLYDVENDKKLIEYSADDYPINGFLENLNSSSRKSNLLKVEYNKIIGNVNSDGSTISGFDVIRTNMGEHWVHGYPLGFEIPLIGDRGIVYSNGDGTVPIDSAKSDNIYSNSLIELNSGHSDLPTDAQKDVVEILTGTRPNTEVRHGLIHNMLFVSVFSPIDIQIISPKGERVGKDFATGKTLNEIDGAYYSGFDTKNEFVTIPNPEDGEYKIIAQGTDDGEYKIEITKISENENDSQNAAESTAEITGTAIFEKQEELEVKINGNDVSAEKPRDITPPTITATITPEPNENGWHDQDVTVHFAAEDNESGIDGDAQKDVVISNEGKEQSITESFSDKFGNVAYKTVSGINIDKTSPKIEITFPKNQIYYNNKILEIKYGATDATEVQSQILFDGKSKDSDAVDLSLEHLGGHSVSVLAQDEAGNRNEQNVTFEITTNVKTIISNVVHYFDLKLITSRNTKNFLEIKLRNIKEMKSLLNIFKSSWMPKWAKDRVVKNLERQINHEIDDLISKIKNQKQISQNILSPIKELLVENLEFIKK